MATSPRRSSAATPIRDTSGNLGLSHAERRKHPVASRTEELVDVREDRLQELLQAGKRNVGFGHDAGGGQDPEPPIGRSARRGRQRGQFPGTAFAAHNQRSAVLLCAIDEIVERRQLALAAEQRRLCATATLVSFDNAL